MWDTTCNLSLLASTQHIGHWETGLIFLFVKLIFGTDFLRNVILLSNKGPYWWCVNNDLRNGLVLYGTQPLSGPLLTRMSPATNGFNLGSLCGAEMRKTIGCHLARPLEHQGFIQTTNGSRYGMDNARLTGPCILWGRISIIYIIVSNAVDG